VSANDDHAKPCRRLAPADQYLVLGKHIAKGCVKRTKSTSSAAYGRKVTRFMQCRIAGNLPLEMPASGFLLIHINATPVENL
jgi:hypothetical protein